MTDVAQELPDWLQVALERVSCPPQWPEASDDLADLQIGDIWTVASLEDEPIARLILVVGSEGAQLDIVLLSPEIDFATDVDVVLGPAETSLPYSVMVETALYGRVWWNQAQARLGYLSDDLVDAILDFVWDERPELLEDRRGSGLPASASGSRATFERHEASEFGRLTLPKDNGSPMSPDERAPLIETSQLEHGESTDAVVALARALVHPNVQFSMGMPWATSRERSSLSDLVGPDIVGWRIAEAAAARLLSGTSHVASYRAINGSPVVIVVSGGATDLRCLELVGAAVEPGDMPLGFIGRTPVVGAPS